MYADKGGGGFMADGVEKSLSPPAITFRSYCVQEDGLGDALG